MTQQGQIDPTCRNCRFFRQTTETHGDCRAHPVAPDPQAYLAVHGKPEWTDLAWLMVWPVQDAEEWCGEHELRDAT